MLTVILKYQTNPSDETARMRQQFTISHTWKRNHRKILQIKSAKKYNSNFVLSSLIVILLFESCLVIVIDCIQCIHNSLSQFIVYQCIFAVW